MELDDLIYLGACSILSRSDGVTAITQPNEAEINKALDTAEKVWKAMIERKL